MPFEWPFRRQSQLSEDQRKWWRILIARLLSPHILLVISCVSYIFFGAWVFQLLEGRILLETKTKQLLNIDRDSKEYSAYVWELIRSNPQRYLHELSPAEAVKELQLLSKEKFDEYVDTMFTAHRSVRHGFEKDPPTWDYLNSFFFTATMLTSIGFGYVCPTTFEGRLFGVIYCLIGLPLTLVTVANIAKFVSESLFHVHYHLWKLWIYFKTRGNHRAAEAGGEPEENGQIFGENEDEQDVLDRIRLIRFPPVVVFMFAIIYGLFGAYIIQRGERWSYLESVYYTFISILTVGFGDYRPSPNNMITVLIVVTGGIISTTMVMDVVGRMYLKEIHYLGRKLRTSNPFYMLREAKTKRRRQAMASLLAQFAKGMIFAHRNFGDLSKKKTRKKSRATPRMPWAPAFTGETQEEAGDVIYNIRYRLKYYSSEDDDRAGQFGRVLELKGIQGNSVEIMSIQSCSLYEFRITAVSKFGESKPAILVQYTEPQLSPQHILATKLNANTVELTWEPPFKRTNEVKNYTVYWTDNPSARLADWQKVIVYGKRVVFPDLKYDWFYLFCANACFRDGQRSPLSRALFIKTDKVEFNTSCVGHSRTIEVMEALCDKVEASETTPLLRRDYVSLAF